MRMTEPGMREAALAATFEYQCAMGGSQRPAYVPVVASGWVDTWNVADGRTNGLVIHYTKNDGVIGQEDVS